MSTKILSGYSAAAFSLQVKEQRFLKHSPDFGWICARHLTEAGSLLNGHGLGKSECFSLKMYLVICRSFGSVVCTCNIAAWGHVFTVTVLAE